jgi:hypothetical protein
MMNRMRSTDRVPRLTLNDDQVECEREDLRIQFLTRTTVDTQHDRMRDTVSDADTR